MAAVRALRTESGDLGLIATLALIFLPFAIWLWASLGYRVATSVGRSAVARSHLRATAP